MQSYKHEGEQLPGQLVPKLRVGVWYKAYCVNNSAVPGERDLYTLKLGDGALNEACAVSEDLSNRVYRIKGGAWAFFK